MSLTFYFSFFLSCGFVLSPQMVKSTEIECIERTLLLSPNDTNVPISTEEDSYVYFDEDLIYVDKGLLDSQNHWLDENFNLRIKSPKIGTYSFKNGTIRPLQFFLKIHVKFYASTIKNDGGTPATEIVNNKTSKQDDGNLHSDSLTCKKDGLDYFNTALLVFIAVSVVLIAVKTWLKRNANPPDYCHDERRRRRNRNDETVGNEYTTIQHGDDSGRPDSEPLDSHRENHGDDPHPSDNEENSPFGETPLD